MADDNSLVTFVEIQTKFSTYLRIYKLHGYCLRVYVI